MLKYNNGQPISVDDIKETEYEECAKEWGEGNKYLEDLILFCLKNGIRTIASCSGHNGEEFPYISFEINEKNNPIIDAIGVELKDINNMRLVYTSKNKNQRSNFVTFELPINDTSPFCGIKRICKEALEGKELKADETLVLARQVIEEVPESEFGSYIMFSNGIKDNDNAKHYARTKRDKVHDSKLVKIYTESNLFKRILQKSRFLNYIGEIDHFCGIGNDEGMKTILKSFLEKSKEGQYYITNASLAKIAKREKSISVSGFFDMLKQRIKTFNERGLTQDKQIIE